MRAMQRTPMRHAVDQRGSAAGAAVRVQCARAHGVCDMHHHHHAVAPAAYAGRRRSCRTAAADAGVAEAAVAAAITVADITPPFLLFNTCITYAWLLLIIAPRWSLTRALMASDFVVIVPSLAFVYFFVASSVIDSSGSAEDLGKKVVFLFTEAITDPVKMASLSTPAYSAQDWVHLLVWDWVVGRYIYQDALANDLPVRPALLLCFSSGPPGLLVHLLTKAVVGAWRRRDVDTSGDGTQ
ncbi:hypothetical protein FOA52_004479 [Chlamydomonas sp. UWO 241]|nr:hypothetical protein FOA52_004479 [Chlamydomonas sp. UWO 241]